MSQFETKKTLHFLGGRKGEGEAEQDNPVEKDFDEDI
jgi:hypothetical protein